MGRDEIINEYFEWICKWVCDSKYFKRVSYRKLLMCLHNIEFIYLIPEDANRAIDGCDLRQRFSDENGFDYLLYDVLDEPCSVLEMMVALCIRIEEQIMDDPDIGNRTGQWFWDMIVSLRINSMTDSHFDKDFVMERIQCFLNRDYQKNGSGGLFTIKKCRQDLRNVEIWYQMCWYLDSVL